MGANSSSDLINLLSSHAPTVEDGLLYLSRALQDPADQASAARYDNDEIVREGHRRLDDLAETIRSSSGLSVNASSQVNLEQLVHGIFVNAGFVGDVEHYHAEDNSFLDRVLIRRVGMPITLSAAVVAVGRRLGIDLNLLGLPGHVVVGVSHVNDVFIDAFGGAIIDRPALEQRLQSIFGRPVAITPASLAPMSTTAVVTRVCNNLMRAWSDEAEKFDRLLEIRVQLPMGASEHQMFLEIAEARARFDLAATLRAGADPNDPQIDALWGRLN